MRATGWAEGGMERSLIDKLDGSKYDFHPETTSLVTPVRHLGVCKVSKQNLERPGAGAHSLVLKTVT